MLTINLSTFSRFATPLIFSSMASYLMLFFDRLILAKYSLDAMNAATMVGNFCAIFHVGLIGVVAIAEVFVGQYNGANNDAKVKNPVWQMVWLSCASFAVAIPLAIWGESFALNETYREIGSSYFTWVIASSPISAIAVAFSSFFIGRGQALIVTVVAIIANILNFLMALALVFGITDIIEPMGIDGAGIATAIAQSFYALILFLCFIQKKHRLRYKTHIPAWDWAVMRQCFSVGAPNAVAHMLELIGWAISLRIVASKGSDYFTVSSIGQTIFFLAAFLNEGLNKATSAMSANCIGAKVWHKISHVLKSAFLFHTCIISVLFLVLVMYPQHLIHCLLPNLSPEMMQQVQMTLIWVWLFVLFDGASWILAGVLTAGGDTKFIMFMAGSCAWILEVLPVSIIFHFISAPPAHTIWGVSVFYAAALTIIYLWRYKSGKWKKLLLQ